MEMRMSGIKRTLALVLILAMAISLLPIGVFSEGTEGTAVSNALTLKVTSEYVKVQIQDPNSESNGENAETVLAAEEGSWEPCTSGKPHSENCDAIGSGQCAYCGLEGLPAEAFGVKTHKYIEGEILEYYHRAKWTFDEEGHIATRHCEFCDDTVVENKSNHVLNEDGACECGYGPYMYTATLLTGELDVTVGTKFVWTAVVDGAEVIIGEDVTVKTAYTEVKLTATYDGVTLYAEASANESDVMEVVVSPEITVDVSGRVLTKGVSFKQSDAFAYSINCVNAEAVTTTWNQETIDTIATEGGEVLVPAVVGEDLTVATLSLVGTSGTIYLTKTVETNIAAVNYESVVCLDESDAVADGKFYKTEKKIRIKASPAKPLYSADYLALTVYLDGVEQEVSWVYRDGFWYSGEITIVNDTPGKVTVEHEDNESATREFNVIVDTDKPIVSVNKVVEAEKKHVQTLDGVDFYNGEVTYTVTITDEYLWNLAGKTQVALFTYTLNDDEPKEVGLPAHDSGWVKDAEKDSYTYSFTLKDGDVLTGMAVNAVDNAGNPMSTVVTEDGLTSFAYDVEKAVWSYAGNTVVVDKEAPVVEVTKTVEDGKQHIKLLENIGVEGHTDLYNGKVTYTVTIKDANLWNQSNKNQIVLLTYTINDEQQIVQLPVSNDCYKKVDGIDTYTYSVELENGDVLSDITVKAVDNADNIAKSVIVDTDGMTNFESLGDDTLKYNGNDVEVDSEAPKVIVGELLSVSADRNDTEDPKKGPFLYNKTEYVITVKDKNITPERGTIVLSYNLNDSEEKITVEKENFTYTAEDNEFTYRITGLKNADKLTNINVVAKDEANNATNENGQNVVIDTEKPVVTVKKESASAPHPQGDYDFYNRSVFYTIQVADAYLWNADNGVAEFTYLMQDDSGKTITLSSTTDTWTEKDGLYEYQFEVADGFILTDMYFKAIDNAGNELDVAECDTMKHVIIEDEDGLTTFAYQNGIWEYTGKDVIVDQEAPVVEVSKTVEDGKQFVQTLENVGVEGFTDFYNGMVTYTVIIKDEYLWNQAGHEQVAWISYILNGEEKNVSLIAADGIYEKVEGVDTYTYNITLNNGDVLTALTVKAIDNAGNVAEVVDVEDADNLTSFTYEEETRALNYRGNTAIVDMEAPEVEVHKTVEEEKKVIETQSGVDFYNGAVTYTITIKDEYLWNQAGHKQVALLTYIVNGENQTVQLPASDDCYKNAEGFDTYSYSFTLENGDVLTDISVKAVDNAGNVVDKVDFKDTDDLTIFTQDQSDGSWKYSGNTVIVDKEAPVVEVYKTVEGGKQFIQTLENEGVEGFSDFYDGKVTYTVTIKDAYLWNQAGHEQVAWISYILNGEEKNISLIAADGIYEKVEGVDTYTYSITLNNGDVLTALTVKAVDNAGNVAEVVDVEDADNLTSFTYEEETGALNYRGNTAIVDMEAPEVEVHKTVEEEKKFIETQSGVDFYNGAVTYTITIKDEYLWNRGNCTQIAVFTYELEGGTKVDVKLPTSENGWVKDEESDTYTYSLILNSGEKLVDMTVNAVDNSGNAMTGISVVDNDGLTSFEQEGEVWKYTGNDVVVDRDVPEVSVTKDKDPQTLNKVDFYDSEVTYTVIVEDAYLWDSDVHVQKAFFTYTLADGTEKVINLPSSDTGWVKVGTEYKYTFTLKNGDILTGMSVNAIDNSGNVLVEVNSNKDNLISFEHDDKEGIWRYSGNTVIVDTSAPVVEVSKTVGAHVQTIDNVGIERFTDRVDFYNGEVTYTVTITDKYMWNQTDDTLVAEINYTVNGELTTIKLPTSENGWVKDAESDTYTYSFTLKHTDELTALTVKAVDNAGNVAKIADVEDADNLTSFTYEEETGALKYSGNTVIIDEKEPVIAVKKTVADGKQYIQTLDNIGIEGFTDEIDFYDGEVTYTVIITDEYLWNQADQTQVALLTYTVNGETKTVQLPASNDCYNNVEGRDRYTYSFMLENNDELTGITVQAVDNAGNVAGDVGVTDEDGLTSFDVLDAANGIFTYSGHVVIMDNEVPGVLVSKIVEDDKRYIQTLDNVGIEGFTDKIDFYNGKVSYIVTVKDAHLWDQAGHKQVAMFTYTVNGKTTEVGLPSAENGWIKDAEPDTYTYSFVLENGDILTGMTVNAVDNAGNAMVSVVVTDTDNLTSFAQEGDIWNYTGHTVIIDTDAPEVEVSKEDAICIQTTDDCDYYNGEVTYTITVKDAYLWNQANHTQIAVFTYELEDGTEVVVELPTSENGWVKDTESDTYTFKFTVKNGQVLTDMTLKVVDNAGNAVKGIKIDDVDALTRFDDKDANGYWIYGGNNVAVDMTAPNVTVEKTVEESKQYVQSYKGYDYYNGKVTYTVTISDMFLNQNVGTAEMILTYWDGSSERIKLFEKAALETLGELEASVEEYTYTFSVTDGKVLTGIEINVKDNAGNTPRGVTINEKDTAPVEEGDEAKKLTTFADTEGDGIWNYTGNGVVCDTILPKAVLEFSDNVKSVYYNKNNNTIYVILKNAVIGESGQIMGADGLTVAVTLTVTDKNLSLMDDTDYGMKATDFAWIGETPVNYETTVTLTAESANVNADGTVTFVLDATVVDLAGNKLVDVDTVAVDEEGNTLLVNVADGCIHYNISADRRRPSSEQEDVTTPIVEIAPVDIVPTTTADGKELFSSAFQFSLHVEDGSNNVLNSGIARIKWSVTDANGVVAENIKEFTYGPDVYSMDHLIDIALAVAAGESNEVTLNIEVEDKVGNIITYQKIFGVDNLAPRVRFEQSNTSAQNNFYFNADQSITVFIEDLNFNAADNYTSVITEVPFGGWTELPGVANTYVTVLAYNADGDYTFAMSTTDLAQNQATIDYDTGMVALQSFTIDKTAPVITLTFDPAVAVGNHEGVQFFDRDRKVTVTINEHNFNADEVGVSLQNIANSMSSWTSNGDIRTARMTFGEGNEYRITVQYTDLAGNPAITQVSPVFSVDKTEPTITMNVGDIQQGQPVPESLILGFHINDAQNNLKDFNVEVLYIDCNFVQSKVSGDEYYVTTPSDGTDGYVVFTDIEKVKANDGIYTVRISAEDFAGHLVVMPDLVFSLNRFGSTFYTDDAYTTQFLTANENGKVYRQSVTKPLVIKEKNPDQVWQNATHGENEAGSKITVSVNGESVVLDSTQYTMTYVKKGTGAKTWYEYTYSIDPAVFTKDGTTVDGDYTIYFYSEDDAANKNTNESNEGSQLTQKVDGYSGKISFTLDHQAPVVTILGVKEGQSIVKSNASVEINVSDNTNVTIAVYINKVLVELIDAVGEDLTSDWFYYDSASGSYKLNMAQKDVSQNLRIVITDAAGNEMVSEINNVTISKNLWVQFKNNLPAQLITGVVLILLIVMIALLLKKRKGKGEAPMEDKQTPVK